MNIDIELGHYYIKELRIDSLFSHYARYIERGVNRAQIYLQKGGATISYSILIDDMDIDVTNEEREQWLSWARDLLNTHKVGDCRIVFESWLYPLASIVMNNLRANYVFTDQECKYLSLVTQDPLLWAHETLVKPKPIKQAFLSRINDKSVNKFEKPGQSQFLIPLYTPNNSLRPYGCSLLTAAWYLNRLGVDEFSIVESPLEPDQVAKRIVNVLPVKFLKSEGFAIDILNLASSTRIRKAAKKIEYLVI